MTAPAPTIPRVTALLKRAGLTSRASKKAYAYGGLPAGFVVEKERNARAKGQVRIKYMPGLLSGLPTESEAYALIAPALDEAGYAIATSRFGDWIVTAK